MKSKHVRDYSGRFSLQAGDLVYTLCVALEGRGWLVFLHGLGGSLKAWESIQDELAERGWSSMAVDLPGQGHSFRPDSAGELAVERIADSVVRLLKHRGIQRPVVVGHCFGGMVAMVLASKLSDIRGLVLLNTSSQPPTTLRRLNKGGWISTLLRILGRLLPSVYSTARPNYARHKHTGDYYIPRILSDIWHTSLRSYCFLLANTLAFRGSAYLSSLKVPTLVVSGELDKVYPTKYSRQLQAKILGARLKIMKNANHVVVLHQPEAVTRVIASFVREL